MKKIFFLGAALILSAIASAQTKPPIEWPDYQFSTDFEIPVTPVKNQTLDIDIHKDGVSKEVLKKLGIK